MSDYSKAANDLKVLAVRLRPLLAVAEFLDKIGSLEDAESHAKAGQELAAEQEQLALQDLYNTQVRLQQATASVTEANQQVNHAKEQANANAHEIRTKAESDGQAIIDQATSRKAEIQQEIDAFAQTRSELQTQVSELRAELQAIKDQIVLTRQRIAEIAGG